MRFAMRFFGKAVFVVVAAAVLSGIVMLLWNAVVPALFVGAHAIDWLHAFGLLLLSRILFGGFRGHGGWRGRGGWRRWQAMTPEEREQFRRDKRGNRCGGRSQAAEPTT